MTLMDGNSSACLLRGNCDGTAAPGECTYIAGERSEERARGEHASEADVRQSGRGGWVPRGGAGIKGLKGQGGRSGDGA